MKTFALVNTVGFVEQIHTSPLDDLQEGQMFNNLEAHELPGLYNAHEVLRDWYWQDGSWVIRGAHPSKFHFWNVDKRVWELDEDQLRAHYKILRDAALKDTDWTQLPDSPLSDDQKKAFAEYRSALRNMTDNQYLEGDLPKRPDTMT